MSGKERAVYPGWGRFPENAAWLAPGDELFVGRHRELSAVKSSLQTHRRARVTGQRGAGKTALLKRFEQIETNENAKTTLYLSGARWLAAPWKPGIGSPLDELSILESLPSLLFVDDAHALDQAAVHELDAYLSRSRTIECVIAHDPRWQLSVPFGDTVALGGLSNAEYFELLGKLVAAAGAERDIAQKIWAMSEGSPLLADLVARTIRDEIRTWNQLLEALQGFSTSGIVDVAGNPISSTDPAPPALIECVQATNEELLSRLRRDPRQFYQLSPRKFEEIVGELLEGMGYEVQLTPVSGDGGFDMYAAKRDDVGRFLFLVECKRWLPHRKVGVDVVRALHGVVQHKSATAGVVATTSFFTRGAKEFQARIEHQLHLNDYLTLNEWLSSHHGRAT